MSHSYEYYVSRGFDDKMARYFVDGRRQIKFVSPNPDYTLTIEFDNGEKRLFDMKPLLSPDTVFAPFMDWANFSRVYVDDAHAISWDVDPLTDSNVVWSNKVDLCPDTCYVDSSPLPN